MKSAAKDEVLEYCSECPHCRPVPPPSDIAAERRVAYAMLEMVSWQSLEPCCADWFMGLLPKMIVANIREIQRDGKKNTFQHLAELLQAQGYTGPIAEDLEGLCDCTPFWGLDAVKRDVETIHELWRQRRIIEALHSLEGCLRMHLKDSASAIESLKRLAGEL